MYQPVVSVIIPIYNAEKTLQRCVNSVLHQTLEAQEILLIDDGSTDGCGAIADAYAAADSRVRVIHKENGGLSSARNCGLDLARGEWISFLDADDWLEKDMLRSLLAHTDADLIVSGLFIDSPKCRDVWSPTEEEIQIDSEEAVQRLIVSGRIRNTVFEKIYRKSLFDNIRFPEGYNFEDIRTTYRLLQAAKKIVLVPDAYYHYVQMKGSIVHTFSAKNCLDRWLAYREQYEVFHNKSKMFETACLKRSVSAAFHVWASLWEAGRNTCRTENDRIEEIKTFIKEHRREVLLQKRFSPETKLKLLFVSGRGRASMFCSYAVYRFYRLIHPVKLYQ